MKKVAPNNTVPKMSLVLWKSMFGEIALIAAACIWSSQSSLNDPITLCVLPVRVGGPWEYDP